jgi:hypothetical protein
MRTAAVLDQRQRAPLGWKPSAALTGALAALLRAMARREREAEQARGDREDGRKAQPRRKHAATPP